MTRAFTPDERDVMQARVIEGMTRILTQANYVRIDHNDVEQILTRESAYGLDLQVDLKVFEEVLLYYRGASTQARSAPPLAQVLSARAVRHPDSSSGCSCCSR